MNSTMPVQDWIEFILIVYMGIGAGGVIGMGVAMLWIRFFTKQKVIKITVSTINGLLVFTFGFAIGSFLF